MPSSPAGRSCQGGLVSLRPANLLAAVAASLNLLAVPAMCQAALATGAGCPAGPSAAAWVRRAMLLLRRPLRALRPPACVPPAGRRPGRRPPRAAGARRSARSVPSGSPAAPLARPLRDGGAPWSPARPDACAEPHTDGNQAGPHRAANLLPSARIPHSPEDALQPANQGEGTQAWAKNSVGRMGVLVWTAHSR